MGVKKKSKKKIIKNKEKEFSVPLKRSKVLRELTIIKQVYKKIVL